MKKNIDDMQKNYLITDSESEGIQILKLWFCIMVVFIHSYSEEIHFVDSDIILDVPIWLQWVKYIISQVISICAVPGYFLLSSILLYKNEFDWKKNIKKKIRTLLIPYFILNTFWILFFYVTQNVNFLKVYFSNPNMIVQNWGVYDWFDAYFGLSGYPILYPLWFVRDLFVLHLLSKFIKKICDRLPKSIFVIISVMLLFNIKTHLFFLSNQSIVFFTLGYYIIKNGFHFDKIDKINPIIITVVYIIAIIAQCLSRDTLIYSFTRAFSIVCGLNFFIRYTVIICNKKMKKLFLNYAKYGFSIYLFHEMGLTIVKKILTKILPTNALFQSMQYLGIPFLIIVFCVILSKVLERYFSKVYNILIGGRIR